MSETLYLVIGGLLGSVITAAGQYLIARLNAKSRQDKLTDLSQKYLTLADMTADQLEDRINLIGKLDTRNREMNLEIEELKAKRRERDEQLFSLEAQLSSLQSQINQDSKERADLRAKLSDFEVKYRAMWQWLLSLLELMKKHDLAPIDPPEELRSDPEIMRAVQGIRGRNDLSKVDATRT